MWIARWNYRAYGCRRGDSGCAENDACSDRWRDAGERGKCRRRDRQPSSGLTEARAANCCRRSQRIPRSDSHSCRRKAGRTRHHRQWKASSAASTVDANQSASSCSHIKNRGSRCGAVSRTRFAVHRHVPRFGCHFSRSARCDGADRSIGSAVGRENPGGYRLETRQHAGCGSLGNAVGNLSRRSLCLGGSAGHGNACRCDCQSQFWRVSIAFGGRGVDCGSRRSRRAMSG